VEILAKRFLLRDFALEDAATFEAYHADPRSLEFYGGERAKPGHATELLDLFRTWAAKRPRRNYQLAIVRRDEVRTLVGCCGLRSAECEKGRAELGIGATTVIRATPSWMSARGWSQIEWQITREEWESGR
jgi:RimJ/RimL family protein N-acetyltransferase